MFNSFIELTLKVRTYQDKPLCVNGFNIFEIQIIKSFDRSELLRMELDVLITWNRYEFMRVSNARIPLKDELTRALNAQISS